jgi:hypothetical protein
MMEAVSVSETSINFYETTRRNIAEHCQIHTRTYDYMKYHVNWVITCKVFWFYTNVSEDLSASIFRM